MGQCSLEPWQMAELLQYLYQEYRSVRKLAQVLGVGKSTVHRWLRGEPIPESYAVRFCMLVDEDTMLQVLKGKQLLQRYSLVDVNDNINKPLTLALIRAALEHEDLRQIVLQEVARKYKEELMELLNIELPRVELKWDEGFEHWLTERKSKPLSPKTLRDYRNLWFRCLEGKVLNRQLIRQLNSKQMRCADGYHPTNWARQIFRHYIRYLYAHGRLDWDTYSRLLLIVPGRRYGRKVLQKPIMQEDVIRSLETLKKERPDIHLLYLVMLYSGARFLHVLAMLREWRPEEVVYVPYLARNVKRLECLNQHCRYYMGKENDVKPISFVFFPRSLLQSIEKHRQRIPGRRRIERAASKRNVLMPKYVRIYALRVMKRVLGDNDTYRFIVGKFGELTVSARHYMDLLGEADAIYQKYSQYILEVMGDAARPA